MRKKLITYIIGILSLSLCWNLYSETSTDIADGSKQYYLDQLRDNPDSVIARVELAKIYRRDSRNPQISEDLVKQALDLDPDNVEALKLQGVFYYRNGLWDKARDAYNRILSVSPDDYDAHVSLSVILRVLGDNEGAQLLSENMEQMR